jgi:hypothetical protein
MGTEKMSTGRGSTERGSTETRRDQDKGPEKSRDNFYYLDVLCG